MFFGNVQRSEVLKLLPLFDVYISFSHTEGFSMSFIEALASGLSVITTDWGDVRNYIDNNGYVINRNEEDLKRHILKFFENDRDILNEMKGESIKIFQQNLSPLIVSEQYQVIYEKSK
uniref:Glycosyltransferase n=1 Tax=Chryseobacterium endophyticum TaxID=1854762 RepID=A0AAU6WV05_9FLAO